MMEFEDHPTEPNTVVIKMPKYYIAKYSYEDLRAAVLAEREACAKFAEGCYWELSPKEVAQAIRARSKHD